jgi:hypothetical protein
MQNILEYELVLANGTIANIKYATRPDLAVAMRGSGDQFGMLLRLKRTFTINTTQELRQNLPHEHIL